MQQCLLNLINLFNRQRGRGSMDPNKSCLCSNRFFVVSHLVAINMMTFYVEFLSLKCRLFYSINQHMWKYINIETMMVHGPEQYHTHQHHHHRELWLRTCVGAQKPLIINLRFPGVWDEKATKRSMNKMMQNATKRKLNNVWRGCSGWN